VGTLYLVATPIGNLDDISGRAIKILTQVRLIAAEDTRHTRKLLDHFKIRTPLLSYFEFNKLARLDQVLDALSQGDVALVSDAGTPALNDPGYELVRAALDAGFPVSPIPGPSAPIAALVSSGLPTNAFLFLGYLPRKSNERRAHLKDIFSLPYTLIFLESPYRLKPSLLDLLSILGNRPIAVARELTKKFEDIYRGNLIEAIAHFEDEPARGEVTLVVSGNRERAIWSADEVQSALDNALRVGKSPSQAAAEVASLSGWPRREIYDILTKTSRTAHDEPG